MGAPLSATSGCESGMLAAADGVKRRRQKDENLLVFSVPLTQDRPGCLPLGHLHGLQHCFHAEGSGTCPACQALNGYEPLQCVALRSATPLFCCFLHTSTEESSKSDVGQKCKHGQVRCLHLQAIKDVDITEWKRCRPCHAIVH